MCKLMPFTCLLFAQLDAPFLLPREVGNAGGEVDVAERRIRLIRKVERGAPEAGASKADTEAPSAQPVFGGMLAPQNHSDDERDSDSDRDILDSNDVSFRVAKTETETEKRLDALNIKVRRPPCWALRLRFRGTVLLLWYAPPSLTACMEGGRKYEWRAWCCVPWFADAFRGMVLTIRLIAAKPCIRHTCGKQAFWRTVLRARNCNSYSLFTPRATTTLEDQSLYFSRQFSQLRRLIPTSCCCTLFGRLTRLLETNTLCYT